MAGVRASGVVDGVSAELLGGVVSDRVTVTVAFGWTLSAKELIRTASFGVAVAIGIGVHVGVGIGVGDGVTVDVVRDLHETVQVITTTTKVAATLRVTRDELASHS